MSSTSSIVELINNAFIDARTADGKRVTFALSELDGIIGATAALFDANDNVIDMRTWQLPLPNVTAERAEAFARALRRMPLSWDAMYPETFPPWSLLEVPTLATAQDFAQVMASPDALRQTLARAFVASLSPGTTPGAPASDDVAARLYDIRMCTVPQAALEAHVDVLARDGACASLFLAVLEQWPDDAVLTNDGGSMRLHLAARVAAVGKAR